MRIARVEGELKLKPRDFGLYDDLAVAHDKLGDSQAALNVMAQKRALLPLYNARDKGNKEAWYRYFANDGTFRAHRFLHDGAKVQDIGDMKQARQEIKRALDIKPNAHFGRERVQLMVMDWIVATKTKKTKKALAEWIAGRDRWTVDSGNGESLMISNDVTTVLRAAREGDSPAQIAVKAKRRRETTEGLNGLVVLGAAWGSPDVFHALAHGLEVKDTVALRYMALLRCRELLGSGKKSLGGLTVAQVNEALDDSEELAMEGVGINGHNKIMLDSLYPRLRDEADNWNTTRAAWMETRFVQNQHPDTNAAFWNGWTQTAPPSLDVAWFNQGQNTSRIIVSSLLLLGLLVVGVPFLLILATVWFLRRRAACKITAS